MAKKTFIVVPTIFSQYTQFLNTENQQFISELMPLLRHTYTQQECLFYGDPNLAEHYCADVCDPSPCDEGEKCILEEVQCVRAPCPPVSTCTGSSN